MIEQLTKELQEKALDMIGEYHNAYNYYDGDETYEKRMNEITAQTVQATLERVKEIVEEAPAFLVPKSKFNSIGAGLAVRKDDIIKKLDI